MEFLVGYLLVSFLLAIPVVWDSAGIFARIFDRGYLRGERLAAFLVLVTVLLFAPFVLLYAALRR